MSETILDGKRSGKKNTYKQKRRKLFFTERKVKCEICSMLFKSRGIRDKHLSIHSDRKEFSCEICSREFRRKDQLKTHYPTHFRGYGLTKHDFASTPLNVLSLQYKPIIKVTEFKCSTCSKVCRSNGHLRSHTITHSNLKPYCCEICSKAFRRNDSLRNHFTVYHPDYVQNYKDYVYIEETNVEDISNKKFQCDICSKSFTCKDSVKFHLFSHLGLKPYECWICTKGFRNKPQLRKHLRKHDDRDHVTPVTQLAVCKQEVDIDEQGLSPTLDIKPTQLTVCKQEVDIDEQGLVTMWDIKPSKVVLRRIECN